MPNGELYDGAWLGDERHGAGMLRLETVLHWPACGSTTHCVAPPTSRQLHAEPAGLKDPIEGIDVPFRCAAAAAATERLRLCKDRRSSRGRAVRHSSLLQKQDT